MWEQSQMSLGSDCITNLSMRVSDLAPYEQRVGNPNTPMSSGFAYPHVRRRTASNLELDETTSTARNFCHRSSCFMIHKTAGMKKSRSDWQSQMRPWH